MSELPKPTLIEECPRCIDEKLVRMVGRWAVCPNCDLVVLQTETSIDITLPPEPKAA